MYAAMHFGGVEMCMKKQTRLKPLSLNPLARSDAI
jgi:hypothetical protein